MQMANCLALMAECRRVHWRHLANTIEMVHIGVLWLIGLNLFFLRPTQVHNPNGKSISSAVSAQLTAVSPYALQWATLSPKVAPSHLYPHLIHDSLGESQRTIQTASWSDQPFSHRWPQSVPVLYNGSPLPSPSKLPLPMGIWTPSKTWFPGPTRVFNHNGIITIIG